MKKTLLSSGFILVFFISYGQDQVARKWLMKLSSSFDSLQTISNSRQKALSAYQEAFNNGEEKRILLFTKNSTIAKEKEIAFIGLLENRDVYRVDLSAVVSKYIGETEKNLERIFREAENKNWILFFDDADELFGKRPEAESNTVYIQKISKQKKVSAIFYCREDCLLRYKKISYILVRQ